jgi:hypothetical protein
VIQHLLHTWNGLDPQSGFELRYSFLAPARHLSEGIPKVVVRFREIGLNA